MKTEKTVSGKRGDNFPKKEKEPSKDPVMKTAWIRVTKVNATGENKQEVVTFTEEKIKDILDCWSLSSGLTYWFIDHIPDDGDSNDHFHIAIKFRTNAHFSTVKNKFPFGKIEPAKNLRSAVQYLIHMNNPEKIQYSWENVVTNCADMSPYKLRSRSQQEVCLQRIFEKIESGDITMFNYQDNISMDVYAKHMTSINNAFKYKTDKVVSNNNRDIKVIYMYGKSGIGKTWFAQDYCMSLYPGEDPCITSSSNDPLQDYKGQKSMVWDDFRDSQFRFADLLKFIDPHTRSSGKSRYVNKHFLGDLIIITSTQRLDFLYKGCTNQDEDMKQFRRRISEYHEFVGDRIRIYLYDKGLDKFVFFKECDNPHPEKDQVCAVDCGFNTTPYEKLGLELCDPVIAQVVTGLPSLDEAMKEHYKTQQRSE